jgi:hypothetical protein
VALDETRAIYVATAVHASAPSQSSAAGTLLRFTAAGTVPWVTGQTSPVFLATYTRPTALAFEPAARLIWVAELDANGGAALGSVHSRAPDGAPALLRSAMSAASLFKTPSEIVSMAFTAGTASSPGRLLVADVSGDLFEGRISSSLQIEALTPLPLTLGAVAAVAAGPGPGATIALRPNGDGQRWSLATLIPR